MAIFGMVKGELFESVCALIGTTEHTVVTSMGTSTYTGPKYTFSPYCNPIAEVCTGAGTNEFDPRILVTLTWTDSALAGEDSMCRVNYAGFDYFNGQTIDLCPESYTFAKRDLVFLDGPATLAHTEHAVQEKWTRSSLSLKRSTYSNLTITGNYGKAFNTLTIAGVYDKDAWVNYTGGSYHYPPNFYLNVMTSDRPTFNDYRLGDGMFQTWTDPATTITYNIEKGRYWDCQTPYFAGSVSQYTSFPYHNTVTVPQGNTCI